MKSEPLYVKVGKRYKLASSVIPGHEYGDRMKPGTCRLTYCYRDGARRYEYEVTPATAAWVAAAQIARRAMEDAISDAIKAQPPQERVPYTKRQLKVLADAIALMDKEGMRLPHWWKHTSALDLSEAAIKAVAEYKP